jgi:hypothetical protein
MNHIGGAIGSRPAIYGTFGISLPRLLLWRRTYEPLPESVYTDYKDQNLPSWSWMVYSGIDFFALEGKIYAADVRYSPDPHDRMALLVRVENSKALGLNIRRAMLSFTVLSPKTWKSSGLMVN